MSFAFSFSYSESEFTVTFHPDKQNPGLSEEEAGLRLQRFIEVDQAWKILSSEESRREFDLQLRAYELKQSWPLDACITLEDMNWDSENECYSYSCRCGGEFLLEKEDAEGDEGAAVVCCDTCSLSIEVKRAT
ncbi:dnaJ homolog subfamily C member 24 isoform X2 [Silurus meridionalis]|uniref:dnaJ homolog subfamily C member 24 isoform X2 n=1 Tax=Silurus meridionalis TaxID=175797 RepID=UPI001EEB1D8C|nr:dnaJ homolog subfamily C member 24 isoform X2 [Silurus meridionalis]